MIIAKRIKLLAMACLLGACASDPLPDYRYYRAAPAQTVQALNQPLLTDVVEVGYFRADGVLGERPIVYVIDDEPQKLSQYHYQLWTDPPGTWIQRRVSDLLANYQIAPSVTVRASARAEPAQLTGTIERFERIKSAEDGGWTVAVALRFRLEAHRAQAPIIEKRYEKVLPVGSEFITDSVDVFGLAIDQITADFVGDLQAATNKLANK